MTLTKHLMLCTAMVGLAGMAEAQTTGGVTRDALVTAYAEFEKIEIDFGPTQVKVEAVDAETGQKLETVYDRATGAVLSQERYSVTGPIIAGVETGNDDRDFVSVGGTGKTDDRNDDSSGPDDSDDDSRNGSDDDGNDDNGGDRNDDHGSDDDGNDDNGGDRNDDHGGDDDGNDDNGGDDDNSGSDDQGGGDDNGGGDDSSGGDDD